MYVNPKLLIYPFPSFPFNNSNRKFVFYVHGSTFILYITSFVSFFKIPHIGDSIAFVWLTSLRMMFCRSVHVAARH